jgi:hypothetical protein
MITITTGIRENKTLDYNEVLGRKVADVESIDKQE